MAEKLWTVAIDSHLGDVQIRNVLHVVDKHSGLEGDLAAADVADAVWTRIGSQYLACMPNVAEVDVCVATETLNASARAAGQIPDAGAHTVAEFGTQQPGNQWLPAALCVKLSLKTDAAIRSGHGWLMLPPVLNEAYLHGVWQAIPLSNAQAFGDRLTTSWDVGTIVAHTLRFRIYSRTRDDRGLPGFGFDITRAVAHAVPAWLRSRLTAP